MIQNICVFSLLLFFLFNPGSGLAGEENIFFQEDFNGLENWKPMEFPKITKHTQYSIEKDGSSNYLKAESNASASGIVFKRMFNVYEYPNVRWRWKINNIYKNGNAEERSGDDNPIRIIIMFKYDPEKAPLGKKIKYGFVKTIYGDYPPFSSLKYIWESRKHDRKIYTNPYAAESMMIILQEGSENTGKWMEEKVNIIEDYRKAFGEDPPPTASLAIMNDSDNTGERAVSYVDYIEVYK